MQDRTREQAVFLDELKRYRRQLDRQQLLTLRGQALAGDVEGARRSLDRALRHGSWTRRLDTC